MKKYYIVAVCWGDYGSEDDEVLCNEDDLEGAKELVLENFIKDCDLQGWAWNYPNGFETEEEIDKEIIDMGEVKRDVSEWEISYNEFLERSETIRCFEPATKTAVYKKGQTK